MSSSSTAQKRCAPSVDHSYKAKKHHGSPHTQLKCSKEILNSVEDTTSNVGVCIQPIFPQLDTEMTTQSDTISTHVKEDTIVNHLSSASSLYRAEGILAVYKPLHWTSQDVVAYIRGILTRDAKDRGVDVPKSKKSKGRIKVGHGGTLDPLAEGVLVVGVGIGTKALDTFLSGNKMYRASAKLGFETTTLDMEGDISHNEPYDHVTEDSIQAVLEQFRGTIQQIPPLYSAIRKNGKKLYEEARDGKSAEEMNIQPRDVDIINLNYLPQNNLGERFPCFGLDVECGGGTYIRSLVRDIGLALKTRATMTHLIRTKQGPFLIKDALTKDQWTPERIAQAMHSVSQSQ